MNEDLLHYIWKFKRFGKSLQTVDGQVVDVVFQGHHNPNAGPDFLEAKVMIGETLWAGNVEIHVMASDFLKHNHHKDKAYDNIILHVVYDMDYEITYPNGVPVPCLELKPFVSQNLLKNYNQFASSKSEIPCGKMLLDVDDFVMVQWLEKLAIERLEQKVSGILEKLQYYKGNWEQVFYVQLARNFGFNLYSEAFEMLAKSLPLVYLDKHKNNLFNIEALLFGQAGFLEDNFKDDYPNSLKKEYEYLKKKFSIQAINRHLWKFLRNRPQNFPTIRIAQFAALINKSDFLFSSILEAENYTDFYKIFDVNVSKYWENHYTFDGLSESKPKKLGKSSIHLLAINTLLPLMFAYGIYIDNDSYKQKALRIMECLPPEKNNIIHRFDLFGLKPDTALHTQALIQLFKNYCTTHSCLKCAIGDQLLNKKII